jgi:acyl-CoA thioester hydrolase
MAYEYQVIRRVEFSDTDMEGIVHYSNFFRYMETVEHGFFRSLGFSVVLSRNGMNICLPRVHASCDYRAPLRFEDEVVIRLFVEKKGTRSLTYQIRFERNDGKEVALGRLVVVCAERQANGELKAVSLPAALSEKIQEAPHHLLARCRDSEIKARSRNSGSDFKTH